MGANRTVTFRIKRFDPEKDRKPHFQEFRFELQPGMTVLDSLLYIKAEIDGSLTFRYSCRSAICGSCAVRINGRNRLACKTQVEPLLDRKGRLTIEPLPYLPILKDLVVDQTAFWEQYEHVKPWLVPPDEVPEKEFRVSPEEVAAFEDAEICIMCGACYSACTVVAFNKKYIGPHALLKTFLRVMDPRDSIVGERLEIVGGSEGVFRCHTIFNCIEACPKGLNPTKAIETLRKMVQKRDQIVAARAERQKHLTEPIRPAS